MLLQSDTFYLRFDVHFYPKRYIKHVTSKVGVNRVSSSIGLYFLRHLDIESKQKSF